ncbi:mCG147998 [Mus musculus]|nr:mCG147998 [Mus musculus]
MKKGSEQQCAHRCFLIVGNQLLQAPATLTTSPL